MPKRSRTPLVHKEQGRLMRTFANRLRELRRERGISQVKLALEAGLHISFIGRLERAESSATLDTVETISRTLGVSAADLLTAPGNQPDPLPALRSHARESVERVIERADRTSLQALAVICSALSNH